MSGEKLITASGQPIQASALPATISPTQNIACAGVQCAVLALPWITIPDLTADTADLPLPGATAVRFGSLGAFKLTGIVAPTQSGRLLLLVNTSVNPITMKNQAGASAPANRFTLYGGVDRVLNQDDAMTLSYDPALVSWREVG